MADIAELPVAQSAVAVMSLDWTMFTQVLARVMLGFEEEGKSARLAAAFRRWTSEDVGRAYLQMPRDEGVDLEPLLGRVTQPALVIHHAPFWLPSECSQRVATRLPNARFVELPESGGAEDCATLLREFVDETSEPAVPREVADRDGSPFRTILFTDLVGHTEMVSRLGDTRGRDVLREHERLTRQALREHGGTEVKSMGDGFMASFGSAQKALECAQAIQRAFTEPVVGEALAVRIGVNAGEPVAENSDLFGASVIEAARIAAKAIGNQVLVADVVRQLVAGKGFLFSDTGEQVLRGLEEPVRVWELRWSQGPP